MIECYLAIKKSEVLIHATIWMNLGDVMPSEKSQTWTQKATSWMIPFM